MYGRFTVLTKCTCVLAFQSRVWKLYVYDRPTRDTTLVAIAREKGDHISLRLWRETCPRRSRPRLRFPDFTDGSGTRKLRKHTRDFFPGRVGVRGLRDAAEVRGADACPRRLRVHGRTGEGKLLAMPGRIASLNK